MQHVYAYALLEQGTGRSSKIVRQAYTDLMIEKHVHFRDTTELGKKEPVDHGICKPEFEWIYTLHSLKRVLQLQ
jgi:hypothetical protein